MILMNEIARGECKNTFPGYRHLKLLDLKHSRRTKKILEAWAKIDIEMKTEGNCIKYLGTVVEKQGGPERAASKQDNKGYDL